MEPLVAVPPADEHDLYPVHEEDTVPETPAHFRQQLYLVGALQAHFPDRWVTGETCLYWEPESFSKYLAPDVAVIDQPVPKSPKRVYLAWRDAPLQFVAEIRSRSSFARDVEAKPERYERDLQVPEYLYTDPPTGDLRLWRMVDDRYRQIPREPDGRVWSAQLGVWFGFDEDELLRVYTRDGTMLLTHEEERRRAEAAEQEVAALRAELERLRRGGA